MVCRGVVDLKKVDRGFERRFLHRFDHHLLHLDVPLWREAVREKSLDGVLLFELLNGVAGKFAVQEVQGLAEVVVDGRAVATVVKLAEAVRKYFVSLYSGL